MIVGTYSSIFIAGALLLYVQPQRGGQKKTVGQAERPLPSTRTCPRTVRGGPEPEAALPEPEAPVANVSDNVRAADAAEAAIAGEGDEDAPEPEPEPTGSRRQRRASSARERRRRRRKRGKR